MFATDIYLIARVIRSFSKSSIYCLEYACAILYRIFNIKFGHCKIFYMHVNYPYSAAVLKNALMENIMDATKW